VLAVAFAIALTLRLAPLGVYPRGDLLADSAFHLRMVEEVVKHGHVPALDPMCEAPEGRPTAALLPTGLYYLAGWFHAALAPFDKHDARFHALLFTALAGALIVVPVFFAARALFARPAAASLAALLAAVIPAHVHRTYAYWLRYDALGTLLATTHVAVMIWALASPGRRRAWSLAALSALALVVAAACWRVALVLPFVELGFAMLWTAWRGSTRVVREAATLLAAITTLLFPLVPWLRAQTFLLSPAWLSAMAGAAALWLPRLAPARVRWPVRGAVLALALGVGWAVAGLFPRPDPYAATLALVPAKLATAFGARPEASPIVSLELGIEELASISPLGLLAPGVLSWLAPWFLAAPFLLLWNAGGGMRRGLEALAPAPALFASLCIAMTVGTLLFERNKVLLAPLAAVACGGLPLGFGARARGRVGVPLAILLAVCGAVTGYHATMIVLSRRPHLDGALRDAMAFLRDHTPADAIVMAPWDHGYETQTYAVRATVTDGLIESAENQRRIVAFAQAALSRAPDSLAALCARRRAGWLLVPPSTQLYSPAVLVGLPFISKLMEGTPLTPAEADRVLIHMMVLGRSYPGFEKVFERDEYRIYRVTPP
jgi:oligosaccharyl transferase STT3 subunit